MPASLSLCISCTASCVILFVFLFVILRTSYIVMQWQAYLPVRCLLPIQFVINNLLDHFVIEHHVFSGSCAGCYQTIPPRFFLKAQDTYTTTIRLFRIRLIFKYLSDVMLHHGIYMGCPGDKLLRIPLTDKLMCG